MAVKRIALLSVHTSPLAPLGGKKTGGMNVYVRELAQELARHGIVVDIFTRRTSPDLPDIDGSLGENVRVIYLSAGAPQPLDPDEIYPYLSQFVAGIMAFTTRIGMCYDLIYSHYWLSGWVANKLKEVWNIPFVHMYHTLGQMKHRVSAGLPSIPDVRVTIETRIAKWADRIIAATPAEHAQLLWLYRADRRKIVVIPPGVDTQQFRPIPQDLAKEKLGISNTCNLLLFVGRIEPLKAVDAIIEAIDVIRNEHGHLLHQMCFAVIGGDPDNPADRELLRLKALTQKMNLGDLVDFLGPKDHRLLPLYYAAATTVIMPSDYESFGMVALEAMASGTPVIATDVGGLGFLVKDHKTGFLVPVRDAKALADAITTILTQPNIRTQMRKNAVNWAQQYNWATITTQLLSVFEEVSVCRTAVAL